MATNVNAGLAEIEVLETAGQPRKVAEFWAERPVVLALIRHFGQCRSENSSLDYERVPWAVALLVERDV